MFRKLFIFALFTFVFSAVAFSQKTDNKRDDAVKLMDRQWIIEAYASRDLKDFDRIVAEDFLQTAGNGKVLTKAEKRAGVAKDYTDPATSSSSDYIFRIEPDGHKVPGLRVLFGTSAQFVKRLLIP